ncbi:phosphate/phosphite/phosphonate ABC transporter substrate-binding protein [Evansella halocellulosilytica]|uniref:phosphate/phosphite/phosphonate ABC transporter substrate-binding protein n=1 Tax=Evansella halocellulosilytica TaxID=2011013 RepID=UPI000BB758FB|nr:phosphate/phosphite/phosphonate ABC transporter substrate-binding protein [Evansella halocellulosilytica]
MRMIKILFVMLLVGFLAACGNNGDEEGVNDDAENNQEGNSAEASSEEWPETLVIGVIPAEDQTSASDRVENFAASLGEELDLETEVFLGSNYNAVIEGMRTGSVDIAFFGPFAYVLAAERSDAEVFAIGAESADEITYQSAFIVPADSDAESLADLEGKDFLFVDPASTSGNIFPRAAIIEQLGVTNEEVDSFFGNVSYSGGHDASIYSVINGDVDGAAIATDVMDAMLAQGDISEDEFTIIDASDDIPRGPDAYRSDLPEDLKAEIAEFYYNYEDEQFFEERGITGFYPVEDSAFDIVRNTAEALGMSPEELLN